MIGNKLGPYEIVEKLGEGGMGEVYRAHDPRIGRDVAIKVSAEQFGERSEREARAVAALNHPNVCTLHDVGPNYLVMELVEGEAPKGPLPLQTALDYARQIADALDAAHEKGIVHRDLKPANIKVRSDGTVKVLDFGLAKIVSSEQSDIVRANVSNSPTMPLGATQAGMILGTAAYMAPEQARGKPVDKRADIWAFGVVFYEMLTGRRAFDGDDVSTILAAVIQSEPRFDGVPANVRRVLESCLEKDPKKRLRDIGDVWKLLDETPAAPLRSRSGHRASIAVALLAVVAAIALWAAWLRAPALHVQPVMRFEAAVGPDVSLVPLIIPTNSSLAISPDGTRVVYIGNIAGGPQKLLTRRLDQPNVTELAGTERGLNPFFSRDGQWVGFWNGTGVFKVPVEGGSAIALGDLQTMTGGDWDDEGNVVLGTGRPSPTGVLRMPPAGGATTPLLELEDGELVHAQPQILPGGKAMLFVAAAPPHLEAQTVEVVSFADRKRKVVARGATAARYLASGHLVYTSKSTMFAVPFDLERLETHGTPVAVLDDVAYDSVATIGQFDVSKTGTLVYRRSAGNPATTLQWIGPAGKLEPILARPGTYLGPPRVSPDGKRIAITIRDGPNQDIWVYEPARDALTRLSHGGAAFADPVWTRDGQHVVYGTIGNGLAWSRADGVGQSQVLLASKSIQLPTSFTPDGARLAYFQPEGSPEIWTVPVERDGDGLKSGTPERFLRATLSPADAAFSPDGRWLAYTSDESGRPEVYVRAFGGGGAASGGRALISNAGGMTPVWSSTTREVLYQAGGQIMAVAYTVNGDRFDADRPRVWAAGAATVQRGFDLAPDGKRVAAIVPVAAGQAFTQDNSVVFILNFFEVLRQRVPIAP